MPRGEHRKGKPPRERVELDPEKREALLALADGFVDALRNGTIPIPERLISDLANVRRVELRNMDETRMGELPVTKREAEALAALSHGLTYHEAGVVLGIELSTVQTLTKAARRKLKAKDTKHAIATALRRGIIV